MPRELIAFAPRTPRLAEYDPPPLGPDMVRIASEFGAPKHGTELLAYRRQAATSTARYDPEWRCFRPREDGGAGRFPLHLGDEFHWNAVSLVSCRTVSLPLRDYGWDRSRVVALAEELLRTGRVRCDGIVQPVVSFEEAPEAYREIDEHPETCVKLGVRFRE